MLNESENDLKSPAANESVSIQPVSWYLEKHGLEMGDSDYVRWSKTNPRHPRNWSSRRKAYDYSLLIFLDFFTTVISTTGTAASEGAGHELGIRKTLSLFSFVSIYMIAQAIGCVVFPPYSESFGRKQLFIAATISYCVSSIAIARASNVSAIIIFRFISGLASAVPTNVVAGSAEDLFHAGHRIWMIYAWAVTTNVGACVGPIFGLWSVLLLFIKESRPSQLLSKAVAEVCKESGDNTLRTRNPDHAPDFRTFAQVALIRPVRLVCTEPIVFICSILTAVVYGLLYLFTGALPIVYKSYGFTPGQASLSFVPLILGIFSGIFTRFYDHRIGFAIGAPLLAIGLWWFAWTIPPQVQSVPWIVSMLPLLLVGYATNEFGCTLTGYISDSYTVFASSAFASTAFLRAICCAGFPLFAGRMFTALTANEASSILAAVASVFCVAPVVLLKYGKKIRERSPFAKYSLEQYRHNEVDRDAVLDDDSSV